MKVTVMMKERFIGNVICLLVTEKIGDHPLQNLIEGKEEETGTLEVPRGGRKEIDMIGPLLVKRAAVDIEGTPLILTL